MSTQKQSLTAFESFVITGAKHVTGGAGKCTTISKDDPKDPGKLKGNNGFGNGGDEPAPGNSGFNGSPNAGQKLEDIVR